MYNVDEMAEKANVIVNGYAFYKNDTGASVLNLHRMNHAANIRRDSEVIESSMDDIEFSIAKNIWNLVGNTWSLDMPKYYDFKICGYYL